MNRKFLLLALCFMAIGFIIYFPGIHAPRYGDDYYLFPENAGNDIVKIWTTANNREVFYRPVEDTIISFFMLWFGWNTTPTHILFVFLHCVFSLVVFYVMVKLKFSYISALFGSLFMLVAQANVTTIGGNDTLGQLLSSLFCFLSLWLLYNSSINKNRLNLKLYFVSIVFFTVSLFCKESSAAFFPLLVVMLLINNSFLPSLLLKNIKRIIITVVPFIIIFIIYYIIHSKIVIVQPSLGSDVYSFNPGVNILKNIAMLLFSIFLPVSSVRTFEALEIKDFGFLAAAFMFTAIFIGIIFYGIWRGGKIKEAAVLICFIIAGFFPFALLNHVNEQYVYFSIPYAGILAGMGAGYIAENIKGLRRIILTGTFIIFLFLNSLSVMEKAKQINECGERSDKLLEQLKYFFPKIEHNGTLVLVNSPNRQTRYSAFKLPEFEVMRYSNLKVYNVAGKNDFKMEVIEWNERDRWKKPGVLMMRIDESDKIIKMD